MNPRRELQFFPALVVASRREVEAVDVLVGDLHIGDHPRLTLAVPVEGDFRALRGCSRYICGHDSIGCWIHAGNDR